MQSKKQQLEPDMEQWTGSKLGKEYIMAAYCHPAYLTYMQSTSCKMPGWMNHKLESRLPGEISDQHNAHIKYFTILFADYTSVKLDHEKSKRVPEKHLFLLY